jgi:hypothetical protein
MVVHREHDMKYMLLKLVHPGYVEKFGPGAATIGPPENVTT